MTAAGATPVEGPPLPLAPGDEVGPYRVEDVLGAGGQSVVYRARHGTIGRRVALKVPRPGAAAEKLLREAAMAGGLEHASIVRVEDVRAEEPVPYLVMELCEGGSLEALLAGGPPPLHRGEGGGEGDGRLLPLARVREIAAAVLGALAFAHGRGVIHRDVKPANILFDGAGRAKVSDFGIGTYATSAGGGVGHSLDGVTRDPTKLSGTPLYIAPEQEDPSLRAGGALDGRADLFSFGKVLFRMLTGASPRTIRPPSMLRPGLDPAWDAYIFRLTEEKPADRFASAEAALAALPPAEHKRPQAGLARRVARVAGYVLLVVFLIGSAIVGLAILGGLAAYRAARRLLAGGRSSQAPPAPPPRPAPGPEPSPSVPARPGFWEKSI